MLRIETLSNSFGSLPPVRNLSLEVGEGEFVTLLGPSGCGKTTTLRMVAGYTAPSSGRIYLEGKDITDLSPQQRNTGMVFQNYAQILT